MTPCDVAAFIGVIDVRMLALFWDSPAEDVDLLLELIGKLHHIVAIK
ncbi:MAG: hypothetical protein UY70_C0016G0018 [Candidatus Kaiserbacteria bacterium GW2011_GWB1_52_6]|uniref:Uncharacterized protein n=3 Tax=Candidatus Kaiseribacteriota TaxID=1752734 RepID=A0A0G2AGD4_9BACT|nr:MAG: hypothetical protein UY67_C0008G0013 [Candidatus Kaiserbacteria bacterium GW2011_GWA2_52_12]KKW27334.1 MAG: hypothetical protein UY70_C0016G0018 [Candidatus Kaiserbacteria bacterium GW2011_GWB1_52_6]KKW31589.1 MAG: hypothetical protein UY74_C0010G0002 [Candidatus Kaiserbacteria bacterium GW2011_GWC2_52_8b]